MAQRWRTLLLGLAALRAGLYVAAIPLVPVLYDDHVELLVLLRPSKEVLLFAGYRARVGDASVLLILLAALPLVLFAIWVFHALARAYRDDLAETDLPGVAGRLLPRKRIQQLCEVVGERGWPVVFLGRLAIMPSTLLAAAAGTTDMPVRTFLAADTAGAVASTALVVGAGYLLGEAREAAGPWLTVVGAAALLGVMVLLGRRLRRHR